MKTILDAIDERNRLLSINRNLATDIENFLKKDDLNKREVVVAKQIKHNLKVGEKALENLGKCLPNFFAGDLLLLGSFYEYYDSLFVAERDLNTSKMTRTKGHDSLDEIMDKKLSKVMSIEQWENLSSIEKGQYETKLFIDEICKQTKDKPFTNYIYNLLDDMRLDLEIEKESFCQLSKDRGLGGK